MNWCHAARALALLIGSATPLSGLPETAPKLDTAKIEAVHRGTRVVAGADGVPISYTGNGLHGKPGIIFVHSVLASSMVWQRQLQSDLAEEFNIAAIDLRGHGASGKPWDAESYLAPEKWAADIRAVAEDAEMSKPVLVAWAYGGPFVIDYVRKYGSESVAGIVLVDSDAGLMGQHRSQPAEDRQIYFAKNSSPNFDVIYEWTDAYVPRYLSGKEADTQKEVSKLVAASLMTPHYVRPFLRQRSSDNRDMVPRLKLPLIFVANEAMQKDLEGLAKQMPRSTVVRYPSGSGLLVWRHANRLNNELRTFVTSVQ